MQGVAFPVEVESHYGDFYTVNVTLNGLPRELKLSKEHLIHYVTLFEKAEDEVAATLVIDMEK